MGSRGGSINARARPWGSKPLPIDYKRCCSDRLSPPPKADIAEWSITSRLVTAARITLPHFSVSATSFGHFQRPLPRPSTPSRPRTWPSGVGAVYGVDDGCRHVGSLGLAAEIGSVEAVVGGHALDSLHEPITGSFLTEMLEHHYLRPERADRVGNSLAHDIEGRTVDRFKHRGKHALGIEIGGRRNTERTRQCRSKVG